MRRARGPARAQRIRVLRAGGNALMTPGALNDGR
jgi:hypothetical protein